MGNIFCRGDTTERLEKKAEEKRLTGTLLVTMQETRSDMA